MQAALAVETPAAAPAEKPEPKFVKLHPSHFFDAATRRNVWSVVPAHNTPYAALFAPEYWAHVARRVRPGDIIEVTAEDGTYFAQLYVLSAAAQAVAVAELFKVGLQSVELPDGSEGYTVGWGGPVVKYNVKRLKDGVRVAEKLDTRAAAEEALRSHLRTLSR